MSELIILFHILFWFAQIFMCIDLTLTQIALHDKEERFEEANPLMRKEIVRYLSLLLLPTVYLLSILFNVYHWSINLTLFILLVSRALVVGHNLYLIREIRR